MHALTCFSFIGFNLFSLRLLDSAMCYQLFTCLPTFSLLVSYISAFEGQIRLQHLLFLAIPIFPFRPYLKGLRWRHHGQTLLVVIPIN